MTYTAPHPYADLERVVDEAWDGRETISSATGGEVRDAVEATLEALDKGDLRAFFSPCIICCCCCCCVCRDVTINVVLAPPFDESKG